MVVVLVLVEETRCSTQVPTLLFISHLTLRRAFHSRNKIEIGPTVSYVNLKLIYTSVILFLLSNKSNEKLLSFIHIYYISIRKISFVSILHTQSHS